MENLVEGKSVMENRMIQENQAAAGIKTDLQGYILCCKCRSKMQIHLVYFDLSVKNMINLIYLNMTFSNYVTQLLNQLM